MPGSASNETRERLSEKVLKNVMAYLELKEV
jgi:hypothetical protein